MAKADINEVLNVGYDALFDTIIDYTKYPKFVDGCTKVEVLSSKDGKSRVKYSVSLIKDVSYVLDHIEDRKKGTIDWKLVEGDLIKANQGQWTLKKIDDNKTDVTYKIDIEFKIPVPSLILGRLVKGNLPSMIKGFAKEASKRK